MHMHFLSSLCLASLLSCFEGYATRDVWGYSIVRFYLLVAVVVEWRSLYRCVRCQSLIWFHMCVLCKLVQVKVHQCCGHVRFRDDRISTESQYFA